MMSKFIVISALFLFPFVIITSISAQFELPKYEFPSDYIITYELDEDAREQQEKRKRDSKIAQIIVTALLLGLFLTIIIMTVVVVQVLRESKVFEE